jgi:hypothetical protein
MTASCTPASGSEFSALEALIPTFKGCPTSSSAESSTSHQPSAGIVAF